MENDKLFTLKEVEDILTVFQKAQQITTGGLKQDTVEFGPSMENRWNFGNYMAVAAAQHNSVPALEFLAAKGVDLNKEVCGNGVAGRPIQFAVGWESKESEAYLKNIQPSRTESAVTKPANQTQEHG